ncbi:MAG: hypothetical protein K6C94_04010 [Candidatus Gastranaerophilales bacterium]|nr:hypothetical protein [Candidatus Gastranaerophilales bacterium]
MSSYLSAGSSGSLGAEWQIQNARRNQFGSYFGMAGTSGAGNMDFQAYLTFAGVDQSAVLEQMEFSILGLDNQADGKLLDWTKSAWNEGSSDDRLFQSVNHGYYTNIDFDNGTYQILDEQSLSESLGMDWSGGKPYDVLDIVSNQVNFYDFVFSGTDDGQDTVSINLNDVTDARWGINKYNITEVNTKYTDLPEMGNVESVKAHNSLNVMLSSAENWLTDEMKSELSAYRKGSSAYQQKLREFAYRLQDNEGYRQGKEVLSPSEKEETPLNFADGQKVSIARGIDGQAVIGLKDVEGQRVNNVGDITGDVRISVGRTDGYDNDTVVHVGHKDANSNLKAEMNSSITNFEFYGQNIEADFNEKVAKTYNVQMKTNNSVLDSSRGSASIMAETDYYAQNNLINLGMAAKQVTINGKEYDNAVVDNGLNNTFISAKNSGNYFGTSATSENATMVGGDESNWFDIAGRNGIAVGGKSDDNFTTGRTAYRNIMSGMDGDDELRDNGYNSMFNAGKGVDSVTLNGSNAIVQMGDGEDYNVNITSGAKNNQVWAGTEYERDADKLLDGQREYFNYRQNLEAFMAKNNMSYEQIQKRLSSSTKADEVLKAIQQTL